MKTQYLIIGALIIAVILSCNKTQELDFSNSKSWAELPTIIDKSVDVFYVYPTLFGGTGEMIMDITKQEMQDKVQVVLLKQASVFDVDCNIYAPYYRQMAMDGLVLSEKERNNYLSIGRTDIEKAFDYYMKNYNNGRPFILAGHSQGSQQLINILKTKFKNKKLMDKLVAAYIIGYSITDEDLEECNWLKIAQSDNDLGVIITYNTQSLQAKGSPVLLPTAHCVNPLIWKSTTEYASSDLNLGGVFFKDNGEIDTLINNFTDAQISPEGSLISNIADMELYSNQSFPIGVYHVYDYSFYYNNLKENVTTRVNAYLIK